MTQTEAIQRALDLAAAFAKEAIHDDARWHAEVKDAIATARAMTNGWQFYNPGGAAESCWCRPYRPGETRDHADCNPQTGEMVARSAEHACELDAAREALLS